MAFFRRVVIFLFHPLLQTLAVRGHIGKKVVVYIEKHFYLSSCFKYLSKVVYTNCTLFIICTILLKVINILRIAKSVSRNNALVK